MTTFFRCVVQQAGNCFFLPTLSCCNFANSLIDIFRCELNYKSFASQIIYIVSKYVHLTEGLVWISRKVIKKCRFARTQKPGLSIQRYLFCIMSARDLEVRRAKELFVVLTLVFFLMYCYCFLSMRVTKHRIKTRNKLTKNWQKAKKVCD